MTTPKQEKLLKIKFKGSRRELYRNDMEFPIMDGDDMIVEAERGEDMGRAILFKKDRRISENEENALRVLRKADRRDLHRNSENRIREQYAFRFCLEKIRELELPMKLIDVECRLDRKKIIFYFTADDRIDFRELVKILASEYKTRIEMRQISTREESRRYSGIGACGEPTCCHQFIDKFEPVSTQLVKEQNLPMNPAKISGCCGKLKCCLRYEHPFYTDILAKFPSYGTAVKFGDREATVEKIDVFQKTITLKFDDDVLEEFPLEEFEKKHKVI